jgi:CheY-like chemotaxis protein
LKIETRNADLDANDSRRKRYVVPGHYVMLQVSDTGMGMSAEVQSHIFEPFYTTKEQGKGTGLGLATVYGVIKQSGGYIWLESEIEKGSTFQVYLPRAEGVEEETARIEPSFKTRGPGTILVAEDEPSLLKLTCHTLKESGYRVLEAEDGAKAIEIAAQFDKDIDLLLTDIVMRGMNGRELAEQMSSGRPSMKVLYMSGYTDGAVATHGVLESGIVILRKPFSRKQLQQSVGEMLAKTTGEGVAEVNAERSANR